MTPALLFSALLLLYDSGTSSGSWFSRPSFLPSSSALGPLILPPEHTLPYRRIRPYTHVHVHTHHLAYPDTCSSLSLLNLSCSLNPYPLTSARTKSRPHSLSWRFFFVFAIVFVCASFVLIIILYCMYPMLVCSQYDQYYVAVPIHAKRGYFAPEGLCQIARTTSSASCGV